MIKPLVFTLLGVALGITGSISFVLHKQEATEPKPATVDMRALSAAPWWALPEDYGAKMIYGEDRGYDILKNADRISISVADPNGEIAFGPHRFSQAETILDAEDVRIAKEVFLSPNAYRGVSACLFSPGALFRFKHNDQEACLLVCVSCSDLAIGTPGSSDASATIGLSQIGLDSALFFILKAFPDNEGARQKALSRGYDTKPLRKD